MATIATPPPATVKTLLIGISGPSSSGKTTLARLLRSIFTHPPFPHPPTSTSRFSSVTLKILHQDDFYLTDTSIPIITTPSNCPSGLGERELQDWDCVESLDLGLFESSLRYVRERGEVGEGWVSKEDENAVGDSGISDEIVQEWTGKVGAWLSEFQESRTGRAERKGRGEGDRATSTSRAKTGFEPTDLRIFVLDGFLLYPDPNLNYNAQQQPEPLAHLLRTTSLLDLKLFLPSSREQTISRRTNRTGYVTLEGFWADPPGYVEDVVWVGFLRDHAWMFKPPVRIEGGERVGRREGEGQITEGIDLRADPDIDVQKALENGIHVASGGGKLGMGELLEWAVEKVKGAVEALPESEGYS